MELQNAECFCCYFCQKSLSAFVTQIYCRHGVCHVVLGLGRVTHWWNLSRTRQSGHHHRRHSANFHLLRVTGQFGQFVTGHFPVFVCYTFVGVHFRNLCFHLCRQLILFSFCLAKVDLHFEPRFAVLVTAFPERNKEQSDSFASSSHEQVTHCLSSSVPSPSPRLPPPTSSPRLLTTLRN